ncbi:Enoyl-CoA hydratase/carnithine racemase [Haloechinothrix alba]|uniref:Enoyl-CoA hydratase/carnithine racemase n=1 Tax=Haloechinothrix alba TaxID=664784 RepID=A0A238VK77_9PSEU|nr:enoyl-CoA hydratase/isomerase family protein [Haloechinothrix alba]SNR34775.1 Enoyl-CoA hydratase/carnithine racemase [Haloechinothrix alba]
MLDLEQREGLAIVHMRRPGDNTLDEPMLRRLCAAFGFLDRAHPVVLTGYRATFAVDAPEQTEPGSLRALRAALLETMLTVAQHPRPVVAAINGDATGTGFALAAVADARLMSSGTVGRLRGTATNTATHDDVLRLVGRIGGGMAETILRTGQSFGADEAEQVGLVDRHTGTIGLLDEAIHRAHALSRTSAGPRAAPAVPR